MGLSAIFLPLLRKLAKPTCLHPSRRRGGLPRGGGGGRVVVGGKEQRSQGGVHEAADGRTHEQEHIIRRRIREAGNQVGTVHLGEGGREGGHESQIVDVGSQSGAAQTRQGRAIGVDRRRARHAGVGSQG